MDGALPKSALMFCFSLSPRLYGIKHVNHLFPDLWINSCLLNECTFVLMKYTVNPCNYGIGVRSCWQDVRREQAVKHS